MTYQDIEVQNVYELVEQGPISILDIRDLNSFNESHIDKAVPANDIVIEQLIRKNLRHQNVLVYCYRGNSSKDFCTLLTKLGFKSVYNLVGGYTAWKKFENARQSSNYLNPVSVWLAEKGFDPNNLNDRIENANTPLMEAALGGWLEIVKALLEKSCDVNMVNDDENNALWFACVSNNLDVMDAILATNINIDHKNVNGATCLIYAASSGKFEVVKKLIEAGADPFLTTHDGFHALDSASTIEILKYLKPLYKRQAENA